MPDNVNETAQKRIQGEPVCIDARRVYDSCGDKDCLADLPVYVSEESQALIDSALNVRIRSADVLDMLIDIEPVPFNRGFYSIDIIFYFGVILDVYAAAGAAPQQVNGLCVSDKKVILYGSEGNVRVFSSDMTADAYDVQNAAARSLPTANVQVAKPIALAVSVKDSQQYGEIDPLNYPIPDSVLEYIGGNISEDGTKIVLATLGVFSIVQLMRSVQMLIPSYDFCIPEKRCESNTDSPCEMFSRLDFPTDEFFPPNVTEQNGNGEGCGCGCGSEQN
ncbi:MAG: hypothetical protein IJH40_00485 [Ruminococcus sp.]|uniref:hypothetical protein n=1 Tax=Ruminococcus sp. TaxID=41978 RepID=UPI002873AEBC|nr:hypothetical protein [Ruminococcus sp.]MBQ3284093.1 hypothetical protein [Ruminococcus sp.]